MAGSFTIRQSKTILARSWRGTDYFVIAEWRAKEAELSPNGREERSQAAPSSIENLGLAGFSLWYKKVQVHQDAILRKQAGDIKKRAGVDNVDKDAVIDG